MDRRTTIKWMFAAAVALETQQGGAALAAGPPHSAKSYGTDPKLLDTYGPGALWPLTLSPAERRLAARLCDTIIPADATSPSASAVGVVDLLDEWISAPYAPQRDDRKLVLEGFRWLDKEAGRRFSRKFAQLEAGEVHEICDDICFEPRAKPPFARAARFFARYRDLTSGAYYTTPAGRQDLQYVGNTPLATFDGPPIEVLKQVGLA
jgi:hypothetical protein